MYAMLDRLRQWRFTALNPFPFAAHFMHQLLVLVGLIFQGVGVKQDGQHEACLHV